MKASLKFREEQKPLFRAKVPLSIVGFPFQSGIVAGESKELSLNLSTFFDSGPSFKIAYRPNDSLNPFSFVFKTGIGHFGSPISSSMTMSAEFNLIGNQNPCFFVHFKPQFGDFTIKKSHSSVFAKGMKLQSKGVVPDEDGTVEVLETPVVNDGYFPQNGLFPGEKIMVSQPESPAAGAVQSFFSGMEVSARTVLPVRNRAVVNFRWGLRFPAAEGAVVEKANSTAGISLRKFPVLVMNKIGIEHVSKYDSKESVKVGPGMNSPGNAAVAETCLNVKRQLEIIQAENGMLRKAMDDLRSEIAAGKSVTVGRGGGVDMSRYREGDRGGVKPSGGGKVDRRSNADKKSTEMSGFGGKVSEEDVSEELKKTLMGSTGA